MTVLITGAAGQDGTILARMLFAEDCEVVGLVKPGTPHDHLKRYAPGMVVVELDLSDTEALRQTIKDVEPSRIYNFGGFTSPSSSWQYPDEVRAINLDAVRVMLEEISTVTPATHFFQASSSHVFEGTDRSPQDETFESSPESPYAKSKADALSLVRAARADKGVFAVSGILYNHESPLRSENFVTRKISMAVARIAAGLQEVLELGDIEVARDWGWAPDYVRAMRLMMEADAPRDYVLATGISHRLSFFVAKAFLAGGLPNWRDYVIAGSVDRPVDTNKMVGDSRRAYQELGWRHTVDFDHMAFTMVANDIALISNPQSHWQVPQFLPTTVLQQR